MLQESEINSRHYRDAMSRFAGAVHVCATDGPGGKRGVTVIAACSVSDDPPIVLVCLNRENPANDCFATNGVFALNTLAAGQKDVADAFSGLTGLQPRERFGIGSWTTLATGAPVLDGAEAVFDCTVIDSKDLATHRVLFGKVAGLRIGDKAAPLIYHDRGYRVLGSADATAEPK